MRGRPLEMLLPAGFAFAIGACAVTAVLFSESALRGVLMVVSVGLFGVWARRYLAAVATGVMAWCFMTGFLVHSGGVLAFGRDDLARLAVFGAAALAGCACGHVRRFRRPYRLLRADARRAPVVLGRLHARSESTQGKPL